LKARGFARGDSERVRMPTASAWLRGRRAGVGGQVVRMRGKIRRQIFCRWFNQWYHLLQWRTLAKVLPSP
jgi:hypothetical protein